MNTTRVKCANCGMIYDRIPFTGHNPLAVGVTLGALSIGHEACSSCHSNAADPVKTLYEHLFNRKPRTSK